SLLHVFIKLFAHHPHRRLIRSNTVSESVPLPGYTNVKVCKFRETSFPHVTFFPRSKYLQLLVSELSSFYHYQNTTYVVCKITPVFSFIVYSSFNRFDTCQSMYEHHVLLAPIKSLSLYVSKDSEIAQNFGNTSSCAHDKNFMRNFVNVEKSQKTFEHLLYLHTYLPIVLITNPS
ncbi:810_t:CDS:1, partial [Acaulospora morrowiae]